MLDAKDTNKRWLDAEVVAPHTFNKRNPPMTDSKQIMVHFRGWDRK